MDQKKPQQEQQPVPVEEIASSTSLAGVDAPRRPKSLVPVTDKLSSTSVHHETDSPAQEDACPVPASPTSVDTTTTAPLCVALSPREPSCKLASVQPSLSIKFNSDSQPMEAAGATTRNKVNGQNFASFSNQPAATQPAQGGASPAQKRTASVKSTCASSPKVNTGRWTDAEHKLFLKGLETFPYRAWKKIATLIKTRTVVQIRTHAQKYYQKLEKEEARMKDREEQMAMQQGFSVRASGDHVMGAYGSADGVRSGAMGKKKSGIRKRKSPVEDSSCSAAVKRVAREKKVVRDKSLSPKEKATATVASGKFFPSQMASDPEKENPAISSPVLPIPPMLTSSTASAHGRVPNSSRVTLPIDLEDHDSILDLVEERQLPVMEYAMALDGVGDHEISPLDSDDLLQLTDDENLDWFTDDLSSDESCSGSPLPSTSSAASSSSATQCLSPASSPLTFGRAHFSPVYQDCGLEDYELDACCDASQISCDATAILNCEDDEDIVLDPEKFLSSYLNPMLSMEQC